MHVVQLPQGVLERLDGALDIAKLPVSLPGGGLWQNVERHREEEETRLLVQRQLWQQQRAVREQGFLQPLSTCVAELRRWQGVQRAAHEKKCAQVRSRRLAFTRMRSRRPAFSP